MARPSHHGGTTWVPLRENYFATPLLSAKEKAYLVRKSCEAAQEVVERTRSTGGPVQWRHVEKYQDVQIYAGQPRGAHSAATQTADLVSMCGVTSVAASVKEIAALFDHSTTRAMKEFSMDNRDLFFDAIVLYNLSPRTKEKPLHQVTAKWIAVKCPRGVEDRDFCYLECQDKFVDSHGRKGWVMCLHSIKLPGCDDLTREFGFVRGSFYHSGIIVVETDRPGYVDVIHMLQMNFKKNTRVSPSFMRERVAFVAKIRTMMRNKRLNEQRYLSDLELVPKKYRSRCTVCQDSFSLLLLRKMNCRKCGEVVCGACSKDFDVKNAKFMETVKLRVCMHCFQLITTVPKSQIPMLEQSRSSTTMSLLGYYEDDQRASFLTQVPSSAAEMAENAGQQRRTKIFLQSMQRQRSSARVPSGGPPMTTKMYYQTQQPRSSQPLRSSQLDVHPSRGSMVDPYSRDTISYAPPAHHSHHSHHHQQHAPHSAASIFDRPYVAPAPQSVPHNYEYNRQSEFAHRQSMETPQSRSRSTSREDAMYARSSLHQHTQSHNGAYHQYQQHQQQQQHNSSAANEYGMSSDPPPAAYPDSLRGSTRSESKRRDSESSESSTSSIDIDSEEKRKSANYVPYTNGDRNRSNSRLSVAAAIPPPLPQAPPSYYSDDIDGRSDRPVGSPHSSVGAPPSYYSDEIDERTHLYNAPPLAAAAVAQPHSFYSDDIDGRDQQYDENDVEDDDSEGSLGSDTDDEATFSEISRVQKQIALTGPQSSLASARSEQEETKAQEFSDTPALPPPTPSAHLATQAMLSRDSLLASSFSSLFHHQQPEATQEQIPNATNETPISENTSEAHPQNTFDLRDSELGLESTMCDTSFLDSDMRQFHDQEWFMKNGRPSFESAERSSLSQPRSNGSRGGSVQGGSEKRFKDERLAPTTPNQRPPIDKTNAISHHVTSPTNSYEGIPSLYAKPRETRQSRNSGQHLNRSETIPLNYMQDSDRPPPPSYASSASSSRNGSFISASNATRDNVYRQGPGSSSSNSSSTGGKSKPQSVTISDSGASSSSYTEMDEEDNGPRSFFGAHSDDIPPIFQQPRSMAGFSATATYEVPKRSPDETKELMRKLSAVSLPVASQDGDKSEPEHESKAVNSNSNSNSSASANYAEAWMEDTDRDSEFGVFDGSILHAVAPETTGPSQQQLQPQPRKQFVPLSDSGSEGEVESEEEDEDPLLSARSLYKSFGSTLKITSLVGGGGKNDASFQRTFDQIQASIDMLSSDDDSDDDDDDDDDEQAKKQPVKPRVR